MSEDEVVRTLGGIGRWQVRQSVLLSLSGVLCAWQILSVVFLAPATEHWCAPPPGHHCADTSSTSGDTRCTPRQWRALGVPHELRDGERVKSQCLVFSQPIDAIVPDTNATMSCSTWQYDTTEYTSTLVIEFDLVCDRKWLQMIVKGIYMVGIMFGVMTWGIIADRYGRRPALLLCLALNCLSSLVTMASTTVQMFLLLRFLTAFFGIGMYTTGFVMSMELVGEQWRALLGITYCLPVSCGFITMGGMAYLVRDWRLLQLALSLPGLLFVSFYWLVPESPRWLLSKGRVSEARDILEQICKFNKMEPLEKLPELEPPSEKGTPSTENFLDVFRAGKTAALFLCLFFCWLVNSMVFYGIVLNAGDFGGNMYLNATLGGVVEVPALLSCAYAIYRLGRRAPISINMLGAGVACLLTLACTKGAFPHDWPMVCLAMMGRFCITASFSTIYIYTAELFPTSVRNTCLAACSVGSRVGGILAPLLDLLKEAIHPTVPVVVFGLTAILSGASVLLLPETAGRPLPEVLADVSKGRRRKQTGDEIEEKTTDELLPAPVVV
ncbi:organic cation transporter protein-like [Amphibalanus amphitrite]|uniref:organic cation transporter protein-like n=1 Tax=Amphibalanus amphitrite TaxID=1232801 RepID=UPI001C91D1B4|nr:organic cation transporter protein-like [Amphibalanus amphitrite]XP_043236317.1 organic cation transporter protein-like [Amphibalanus amphitrite]XP_043236318.1 organic cation transporter protein-like [Amphibalanus amphitrite]XP_043236319.1 organic cation transporter protein-like [Amphibalanus amphitrite]